MLGLKFPVSINRCGTSSKLLYFGRAHNKFAFCPLLLPSVSFHLLPYCLQPHLLHFYLKCFLHFPPWSHFLLLFLKFRFRTTHILFATTSTIKWYFLLSVESAKRNFKIRSHSRACVTKPYFPYVPYVYIYVQ